MFCCNCKVALVFDLKVEQTCPMCAIPCGNYHGSLCKCVVRKDFILEPCKLSYASGFRDRAVAWDQQLGWSPSSLRQQRVLRCTWFDERRQEVSREPWVLCRCWSGHMYVIWCAHSQLWFMWPEEPSMLSSVPRRNHLFASSHYHQLHLAPSGSSRVHMSKSWK